MVAEIDTKASLTADTAEPQAAPGAWPPATPEDFVKQLWPVAEQAGRELGIDPKHILAQAALETGWGRAVPSNTEGKSSNNFFGIKTGSQWTGDAVAVRTLEFENGLPVPKTERFRSYGSPQDCFRDYVALLKGSSRYSDALNTGADVTAFAAGLQKGGYATDPAYARKIASIAQNLTSAIVPLKSADARPINPTPEL
jgi:flagellar protein FlgJ